MKKVALRNFHGLHLRKYVARPVLRPVILLMFCGCYFRECRLTREIHKLQRIYMVAVR